MTENTTMQLLEELKAMVAEARPVPMSASCMVNRADTLALLDQAIATLPAELDRAQQVLAKSSEQVLRGRDEGDRIRIEAEEWAENMASQTEVARRAQAQADKLLAEARAEAEGLRHETDAYVETRMAEFEAALAKTASQVRTMRARLAERLPQREDDDTITLPKL